VHLYFLAGRTENHMLWLTTSAIAAQLHYVLVVNEAYVEGTGDSWSSIPSSEKTATLMLERLQNLGGTGMVLHSKEGALLDREDLLFVVRRQGAAATRDTDEPILVVYVMGHAVGVEASWEQWLMPGDVTVPPSDTSLAALDATALSVRELLHELDKHDTPYLVLVDTCHEGDGRLGAIPGKCTARTANPETPQSIIAEVRRS